MFVYHINVQCDNLSRAGNCSQEYELLKSILNDNLNKCRNLEFRKLIFSVNAVMRYWTMTVMLLLQFKMMELTLLMT